MRKLIVISLLVLSVLSVFSQPYGNEWINYSQSYYKIKVAADRMYRIDSTTLAEAGIPVGSIDPRNFQMFGRGKELHIYVEGESDGVFDSTDFIEFYGQYNNGWLDSLMYETPEAQNNSYYSLYNDTATYYLTWNNSTTNRRMSIETDTTFSNYTPLDWFWKKSWIYGTAKYYYGQQDGNGISLPKYTAGEGWFNNRFIQGGIKNYNISSSRVYQGSGAPDGICTAISASTNSASSSVGFNHHLQVWYGIPNTLIIDSTFSGYQLNRWTFDFPNAALANGNSRVVLASVANPGITADDNAMSNISLKYPRYFDLTNNTTFYLYIPHNVNENKSYIDFYNFNASAPILYDITDDIKRISVVPSGGTFHALVPNRSGEEITTFLTSETAIVNVDTLLPVTATGMFTDFGAMNLDSAYLIVTHESLMGAASMYGSYRSSVGYNVLLADVDELYHQFAYGIEKHPLSIRNYADFLLDTWSTPPGHLFLIGKSIFPAKEGGTNGSRNNVTNFHNNLVPSYGYPPSDIAFTAGLTNNGLSLEPAIATGRISVENEQQAIEYLDKVILHESPNPDPAEWMKNILHFGGGSTTTEQQNFAGYLAGFEQTIEDTSFGGNVHTFLKTTSSPYQITLSDSIRQLIEDGVSIMTFFGHASGSGFDQTLDAPSSYNNYGKYPILIGNSCYTGDIHQPTQASTSESFTLIADRGVIGFIASVKLGIAGNLNQYTGELYNNIGWKNYGGTIGHSMKKTINHIENFGTSFYTENVLLNMTLQGDPAIRINSHPKPDFSVNTNSLYFEPAEVTAQTDSFDVNVIITNLGKAVDTSFRVDITRTFPNGADTTYFVTIDQLYYKDTITLTLPVDVINDLGVNTFSVHVDAPIDVSEIDDFTNNVIGARDLIINTGGIIPVYPYEYAIVPDPVITLKASTGDPFEPAKNYVFEIDTTDLFNSPVKVDTIINHIGGVVEWRPTTVFANMNYLDSTVYFWRVSPDSIDANNGYAWRESSFQYITGKHGWGQAHYFQYKNNDYTIVDYDRPNREFDFPSTTKQLTCQVYGNSSTSAENSGTLWKIDLELQDYHGCGSTPSIHVAVIDSTTLEAWGTYAYIPGTNVLTNFDHQFGNQNNYTACRSRVEKFFVFRQTEPDQMASLDTMLNQHIPDGNYVLIYTWKYVTYNGWNTDLYNTFQTLGVDSIGIAQDSVPFICFYKKGDPSSLVEVYGQTIDDFLTLSAPLQGTFDEGLVTSEIAGPAAEWGSLHWRQHPQEVGSTDSTRIKVIGIKVNGEKDYLANFVVTQEDIPNLYNYVDANIYPWVQLEAYVKDGLNLTPAQMDRWQLIYEPMPEAALNPAIGLHFHSDSVQEGNELEFAIAIENISEFDMDSLLVSYWIEDGARVEHYLSYNRQDSLRQGQVLLDTLHIATEGYSGLNYLWVEANPVNSQTGYYDQLEQYHFNNIAQRAFYVNADNINPILDVTFDGLHIMDGDIISAEPEIVISLDDENPYLIMNEDADTAHFAVYLTDPNGVQRRVWFMDGMGNEILRWIPASAPENKFRIDYNPRLLTDGTYELWVEGNDKSGNQSGDFNYKISFEVINKSTITEVLNYPNPFTTRTHFIFTLTGTEPPEYIKIQIMTITGTVVREITQDELGPLKIGRNYTEFYWDGTDQFGDRLANGVYLYRVIARTGGETVEVSETAANKYFHKGFGKMYLMR